MKNNIKEEVVFILKETLFMRVSLLKKRWREELCKKDKKDRCF